MNDPKLLSVYQRHSRKERRKSTERANPYSKYVLRIVPNLNIEVVSKPRGFKRGCCGGREGGGGAMNPSLLGV